MGAYSHQFYDAPEPTEDPEPEPEAGEQFAVSAGVVSWSFHPDTDE